MVALSRTLDRPLASLSTDEIAVGLGISRSTLYRRIGSREALLRALREQGIDTGEQPSATERMLDAAAALIREEGLPSLTLEAVAVRAGVALPTVFARFRNRSGLLVAVFERHSPVPRVQRHLAPLAPGDVEAFRTSIQAVYGEIWDLLSSDHALISGLIVEVLRDPTGRFGRSWNAGICPRCSTASFRGSPKASGSGSCARCPHCCWARPSSHR